MLATRNCQVGILSEVLEFLKEKLAEKERGIILNNVSKDNSVGEQDVDDIPTNLAKENKKKKVEPDLATEALVFSIVSYTNKFQVPVGYFFVNKISGSLLKELTLTIIRMLARSWCNCSFSYC